MPRKNETYVITDETSGAACCTIEASSERSALKKHRRGMLSSGIYEIVTEKDGRPRLTASYGKTWRADRQNKEDTT